MTNADRIRQMTDEELATKLCVSICNMIPRSICDQHTDTAECDKCILDWLKQEAKDGGKK